MKRRTARKKLIWDSATAQPVSEPFAVRQLSNRISFSQDDHWLTGTDPDGRLVLMPQYHSSESVPAWLPELAEALARERIGTNGIAEEVPVSAFLDLRKRLANLPGQDFYSRWVRWFLADRETRTPYPEF